MPNPPTRRLRDYAIATVVGVAAAAFMLTGPTILGTGGLWAFPGRDLAQNLTGHLAVQAGPLHWPLLLSTRLDWPLGLSVAMTDSNPLATLAAMLPAWLGLGPLNGLGLFLALCWLLQPIAAVYAMRGFAGLRTVPQCPPESVAAAALLCVMVPALFARFPHINLLAHFTLLAALGLAARMLAGQGGWGRAAALQAVTVLIHPYLFVFNAAVLAAPVLGRWRAGVRGLCGYAAAMAGPVLLFRLLSGSVGGWDWGFGHYSMNLLSPVWPQRSGLFGRDLPVLDGTGGQYEGFNYLGAGALALIAIAGLAGGLRPALRRWPLLLVLLGLMLLALTPRIYAGSIPLASLPLWPWSEVFGFIRASGRAFWPVGYALVIGGVAFLSVRLPRRTLLPVLAAAVLLQFIDTDQVRHDARSWFARGDRTQLPPPPLDTGLTLLRVVPACEIPGRLTAWPDLLRLQAIRLGAAVADMRASRPPPEFSCPTADAEALGTALRPGETRVFLNPATVDAAPFGPEASCTRRPDATVCSRPLSR